MRGALRRVGHIAWNEVARGGGRWDRRTVVLLLALGVASGILTPLAIDRGVDVDHGIYRVNATGSNPLLLAVQDDPRFRLVESTDPFDDLRGGAVDLLLTDDQVLYTVEDKSRAALEALREAAEVTTFRILQGQPDPAASFPVRVSILYEDPPILASAPLQGGGGGGGGNGPADDNETDVDPDAPPARGSLPGDLEPPLPFRPLLLAYAFLIPMNFVVLGYGTSVIGERVNRRGEALLASPASGWEVVTGKTLPYAALVTGMTLVIAPLVGAGPVSVLAILPLALGLLALTFVGALFARSFRELTFLTVFVSVVVTTYAFLPAVFSEIHPVAFISPITVVVWDIQGRAVSLGQFAFSTVPLTLAGLVLYRLGIAITREEDLFTQKPLHLKALDSVARLVRGPLSCAKVSLVLIPLVLAAELLLVAFLFAWPFGSRMIVALTLVALIEEAFKAAGPVAGLARGALPTTGWALPLAGILSGAGFFLAEKLVLIGSLVGLTELPTGSAILGVPSIGLPLWVLLLMPLALHVVTAGITAASAKFGRTILLGGYLSAVVIHTAYNLTVVTLLG